MHFSQFSVNTEWSSYYNAVFPFPQLAGTSRWWDLRESEWRRRGGGGVQGRSREGGMQGRSAGGGVQG